MNSSPIGQVRATPQHVPSQYCSRGRPRISASLPPPPRPTTAYARKIQHVPYSVCAYIWSSDYLLVWVTVLHFDRYDHSNVHKSFQKKNLDFINGGKGGGVIWRNMYCVYAKGPYKMPWRRINLFFCRFDKYLGCVRYKAFCGNCIWLLIPW